VDTAPLSDPKAPTEMAMGSGGSGGGGLATLVVEATLVEVDKKATKEAAAEKAVADKASVEEKVVTEASAALAKEATVVTTTKEVAGATLDPKVGAKWVAPSSGGRSPHPKWFRGSWAFKPPPVCCAMVLFVFSLFVWTLLTGVSSFQHIDFRWDAYFLEVRSWGSF
jgi:hypothetical protein